MREVGRPCYALLALQCSGIQAYALLACRCRAVLCRAALCFAWNYVPGSARQCHARLTTPRRSTALQSWRCSAMRSSVLACRALDRNGLLAFLGGAVRCWGKLCPAGLSGRCSASLGRGCRSSPSLSCRCCAARSVAIRGNGFLPLRFGALEGSPLPCFPAAALHGTPMDGAGRRCSPADASRCWASLRLPSRSVALLALRCLAVLADAALRDPAAAWDCLAVLGPGPLSMPLRSCRCSGRLCGARRRDPLLPVQCRARLCQPCRPETLLCLAGVALLYEAVHRYPAGAVLGFALRGRTLLCSPGGGLSCDALPSLAARSVAILAVRHIGLRGRPSHCPARASSALLLLSLDLEAAAVAGVALGTAWSMFA
jgi:hypothetical protein